MVLAYFLGFFVFVVFVSNLEYRALSNPLYTIPLLLMLAGAWFVAAGLDDRIADIDKQVIFEEQPPSGFELLDLEQRS
jgi:positive regulator of sigma E activity